MVDTRKFLWIFGVLALVATFDPPRSAQAGGCVLICPSDLSFETADPCGAVITYTPPTGGGQCAASVVCFPPSGTFLSVGEREVTCFEEGVVDGESCDFQVTIALGPNVDCDEGVFCEEEAFPDCDEIGASPN